MGVRSEEDPDDEPDEEPNHPGHGAAYGTGILPNVGLPLREWEFSTQVVTVAQLVDGVTLVKLLKEAGTDGWELTDVIDGGEKRVLLMRRPKRSSVESRRVGVGPPGHNSPRNQLGAPPPSCGARMDRPYGCESPASPNTYT